MNPISRILTAILVVGMIALAPGAIAQVETLPPPTQDELRAEREFLQHRADRFERGLTTADAAAARIRDAGVRADVQQRLRTIRDDHTQWHTDWTAFQDVPASEFRDRRADIDQRLTDLETGVAEARLRAAETPADFRRVTREYVDLHRKRIADHHARLDQLPREQRSAAAWDLIQLRTQLDHLEREQVRMQYLPAMRFAEVRPRVTTELPRFHSELHRTDFEWRMHPNVVAGARIN